MDNCSRTRFMKYRLLHLLYFPRYKYYRLKQWIRFQRSIYSIPKEARPMFWAMQQDLSIAKAHLVYDLGELLYGKNAIGTRSKELNGLGDILK
jgi:hypothetical protein